MTDITINRAVVEQALEALEDWNSPMALPAMVALRAALAQQAEPVEPITRLFGTLPVHDAQQAEPVLQTCNCRWDGEVQVQQCTLHEAHIDAIHEWAERAKVAERKLAQQAEPVEPVEPVAEARYDGTLRWLEPHGVGLHRIQGPLYTAPPQRQPLTKEEIERLWYLSAAMPQQAEPVAWVGDPSTQDYASTVPDPQIENRLARHGIPMPEGDNDGR